MLIRLLREIWRSRDSANLPVPGASGAQAADFDALHLAGVRAYESGRLEEAGQLIANALKINPRSAEAHSSRGSVLACQKRYAEALASFDTALAIRPGTAEALYNRGNVFRELGRHEQALADYGQVVAIRPELAAAWNDRGIALAALRRTGEALTSYAVAIALAPDYADALNNRGHALDALGRHDEALASYQKALTIKPDYADVLNNRGNALHALGRYDEALATYRRALEIEPGNAWMHSNLLFSLSYRPGVTLAELAEAHAEFERQHALPLRKTWAPHENSPDPGRPLRLGFVSADLGLHPIGYLMADVLAQLKRRAFAAFVYSSRRLMKDAQTYRLMQSADQWRDVAHLDDEALAEQIRADRIDVLFDLSGHTGQNRLLVFARRPAPIQVTWMGYAGTTGLQAIDYLFTDGNLVPPQFDRFYAEAIVRLPGASACYRHPEELPEVGPLPALRNGFVTFGSFNNSAKISPEVVALWSKVLTRLPTARLVLKYLGIDEPACRERFSKLFSEGGVDPTRLTFLGYSPMAEMFARYNEVDIALDPFPYTGGTTTLLSLSMGVPVVTLLGETMPGRQSFTILKNVGLDELVATDAASYVGRAAALAGDLAQLAALRAELRPRLLRSPYFDAPRFVRQLEATLRELWHRWCENPAGRGR